MRKIYYSLVLLLLASCGSRDTDFFNGEIIDIKDKAIEKEVEFKAADLDGLNFGWLSVYDSLAIYMNPKLSSHWYQIYNLNTFGAVGLFAMKGNGHNEFSPVGMISNYCIENNDLKTLISEPNMEDVHIWNITKSIASRSTVIERTMKMPWRKPNKGANFKELFMKDCDVVYAKVTSAPINDNEATLPYYQIRDLKSGEKTDEIHIFKKGIINKHKKYLPETFLYTNDAIKPDGSKIVQVMPYVPQLNIIDMKTKKVVGYHLNYGIGLSDMERLKDMKIYFTSVSADDDYIYAVFWGKELDDKEIPCRNQVYIFDWNGNLVRKIVTRHCIYQMAVDPVNKILYTTSTVDDKLYYIDTEELIGNFSK